MYYEQYFNFTGNEAATITSVTSKSAGLEVLDRYLEKMSHNSVGVVDAPLSPKALKLLRPLNGGELPPGKEGFVVTEIQYSGSPNVGTDTDLTLNYELDGKTYKATFPNAFSVGQC